MLKRKVSDHIRKLQELASTHSKTANDRISDVADPGLQWQEILGQSAVLHLVFEEFDQVSCNSLGFFILGRIFGCLVRVVFWNGISL